MQRTIVMLEVHGLCALFERKFSARETVTRTVSVAELWQQLMWENRRDLETDSTEAVAGPYLTE